MPYRGALDIDFSATIVVVIHAFCVRVISLINLYGQSYVAKSKNTKTLKQDAMKT